MGDDLLGTIGPNLRPKPFSLLMVRTNRWLARWVSAVIVKSPEMAAVLEGTPCEVLPNGVDVETFHPIGREVALAQLGWSPGVKRVLFPGRPDDPRKGYALFQASLARLKEVSNEEIEPVVLWNVEPDRVATYMNACDAMLMLSRHEGSPNVVKEALACDLPIVSVPVGDVESILEDAPGHRICSRDPEDLARGLAAVLAEPRPDQGQAVIERKGLGIPAVAAKVLAIYDHVLGRKDGPAS